MADPVLQISQTGNGTGDPTVSRDDLLLGAEVSIEDLANPGLHTWDWILRDKPTGSTAVLVQGPDNAVTFTPDVAGSYLVQVEVDGQWVASIVAAVKTANRAYRIPAAHETTEFGINGWAPAIETIARDLDLNLGSASIPPQRVAIALNESTAQATPQVVGTLVLDPASYPDTTVNFVTVGFVNGAFTGKIQLYNLTDTVLVREEEVTSLVPVQTSYTFVPAAGAKAYEVRIISEGTPPDDRVFAMWAGFEIITP